MVAIPGLLIVSFWIGVSVFCIIADRKERRLFLQEQQLFEERQKILDDLIKREVELIFDIETQEVLDNRKSATVTNLVFEGRD